MLNMPILKFEKSTNFLNEQLDIQLNNKQLVSDIISNIDLILANASDDNKSNYLNIRNSTNKFLQIISQNITTIEELKREIKHITYDLTEVLGEANKKEKSKEYYIATISSIKNNIEQYTLKFQEIEKKLEQDNIDFNDFININNFKYNFISNQNNDTYEFSSFSIDNQVFSNESTENESTEKEETISNNNVETTLNSKEEKIDELTNEFKTMLSNLSEDAVLSFDLMNSLKDEFQNINSKSAIENTESEKSFILGTFSNDSKIETDNMIENNGKIDNSIIKENIDMIDSSNIEENIDIVDSSNIEENTSAINNNNVVNANNVESANPSETSNIIIDYNSIYGNYHSNISTIEEDILSEYSNFVSSPLSSKNEVKEILLKDETIENKANMESNILEEAKNEDFSNIIDEISDDDLLAELLMSDTPSEEILSDIQPSEMQKTSNTTSNEKKVEEEPKKSTKINYNNFSNYDIEEKIKIIKEASTNNYSLIISEKKNKIFLPYTIDELEKYLKIYPEVYTSLVDVVEQEFILPFDTFLKHPARSRFTETYNLIRNRQGKSIFSAIMYAFKLIGKYNLNPAIIAACKTEHQLDSYLYYLNSNNLDKFKTFKIIYEINPL